MKVLPGDDIRGIMQWAGTIRIGRPKLWQGWDKAGQGSGAGQFAAILLWMHNGLGYIYRQVSG